MSEKDNVVTEETVTEETVKPVLELQPKNKKKLIPFLAVLLVVVVILIGGFYYYFSAPSRIVTNIINNAYSKFSKQLNRYDFDIENDPFKISGDLVIDTNIDELKDLKKETINYTLGVDYKNEKLEGGLALKEGKNKIIDVMGYILGDTAYISLEDDYDKLIKIDDEDMDFEDVFDLDMPDITTDDIDYIAKEFKDILIASINMDEITKESTTIKLDGKSQKVNKLTYKLDEENVEEFVNNFIDKTLDNEKLLKKLSELTDTDVEDIEEYFEDSRDDDFEDIGKLNIYTKGITNKLVKIEFKTEDVIFEAEVQKNATVVTFRPTEGEEKIVFTINEYSDEEINVDFLFNIDGEKVSGNITVTSKETKKNNYEGKISYSMKYDDYKLSITSNYKLELNAKIADINTKNAVSVDDIDVDEFEKIGEDILERLEDSNLADLIEEISNTVYSSNVTVDTRYDYYDDEIYDSYDDDDDYDFDWDY